MSYFTGKMHQIGFRLGLRPRPRWGNLRHSAPPDALAGFKGPTSKGRGKKGMGSQGRGRTEGEGEDGGKGRERERRGGKVGFQKSPPPL